MKSIIINIISYLKNTEDKLVILLMNIYRAYILIKINPIIKFIFNYKHIFITIFIIWLLFLLFIIFTTDVNIFPISYNLNNLGVFGDSFNVLTSLFTGLAFAGVIVSVILQTTELTEARKQFEISADSLKTQSIENTFFNMLDLHHKISENIKFKLSELNKEEVNDITYTRANDITYSGVNSFNIIIEKYLIKATTPEETFNLYKKILNEHNHILGHYFRNLYQILKLIENIKEREENKEKNKYEKILRAQLSSQELTLLFLNCLEDMCDDGQFRNLVIKYSMLEHLIIKNKRNSENLFLLSNTVIIDDKMLAQFYHEKNIPKDYRKYAHGAFGKNQNVPYDLIKTMSKDSKKQMLNEISELFKNQGNDNLSRIIKNEIYTNPKGKLFILKKDKTFKEIEILYKEIKENEDILEKAFIEKGLFYNRLFRSINEFLISSNKIKTIYLPLYAPSSKELEPAERSGINQWNARGRKRHPNELYIPVPMWIHRKIIGFFPKNNDDKFTLILNNKRIQAKMCQSDQKGLMSNPNRELGKWLLRDKLKIPEGTIVTRKHLENSSIDSLKLEKISDKEYIVTTANVGDFEKFKKQFIIKKD